MDYRSYRHRRGESMRSSMKTPLTWLTSGNERERRLTYLLPEMASSPSFRNQISKPHHRHPCSLCRWVGQRRFSIPVPSAAQPTQLYGTGGTFPRVYPRYLSPARSTQAAGYLSRWGSLFYLKSGVSNPTHSDTRQFVRSHREPRVAKTWCVRSARGSRRSFPTVGLVASGGSEWLRIKDLCIITDKLNNILKKFVGTPKYDSLPASCFFPAKKCCSQSHGRATRKPRAEIAHHVFATRGSPWLHTNCLMSDSGLIYTKLTYTVWSHVFNTSR